MYVLFELHLSCKWSYADYLVTSLFELEQLEQPLISVWAVLELCLSLSCMCKLCVSCVTAGLVICLLLLVLTWVCVTVVCSLHHSSNCWAVPSLTIQPPPWPWLQPPGPASNTLHRSPRPATAPTSRPRPGHHHQPASTPLTGVLFIKYFTDMRTFQQVPHCQGYISTSTWLSRVFVSHEYFSLNQE